MSSQVFKVGDLVIGVGKMDGALIEGRTGVIVCGDGDEGAYGMYGVQFDEQYLGVFHGLMGKVPEGYGYWVFPTQLIHGSYKYVPSQDGDRDDDI